MKNIYKDIKNILSEIQELKVNSISKGKINLMIKKELHKQLHTITERTTAQALNITARNKLKRSEKRVLRRLDSIKLMKAIQSCIAQRYSTSAIKEDVMNRFDIGERCFYNYLKRVREQLHITASAVIKNK